MATDLQVGSAPDREGLREVAADLVVDRAVALRAAAVVAVRVVDEDVDQCCPSLSRSMRIRTARSPLKKSRTQLQHCEPWTKTKTASWTSLS